MMKTNQIALRHRVAGVCCATIICLLCAGCARKSTSSSKSTSSNKKKTKPAVLYKNAQKEVVAAEFVKTALSPKQIAALRKHAKLKEITFYECREFGEEICDELAKLNGVSAVHFVRSTIDDSGLARLSKMPAVAHLTLSNSDVTSKGIAALKNWKKLKRLTLKGNIQPDAIKGLSVLDRLESLEIAMEGFVVRQLAGHAFPSIRSLSFPDTEITDEDLSLLPGWKTLEVFAFPAGKITDVGVAHFKKFPSLKNLVLTNSKITDAGLAELLHLKKLEELTLNNCEKVTNHGMNDVATMPVLKRLLLENSGVTGAGLL